MKLAPGDRFSDLSPAEIHEKQRRIAAAFGDAFAAALADEEPEADATIEIDEFFGTPEGASPQPHHAGVVLPVAKPR